ncbi:MAG: hypothetical protein KC415_20780, partial [Anaerolineales bacterium]|nr:hypothetical protein [Anaerolineales bacterium]
MSKPDWPVEIIRSERRRKSVSAEVVQGTLIVRAPAAMSDAELQPIIDKLRTRLYKRSSAPPAGDEDLEKRAQELNGRYFSGKLRWQSVRYVTNQNKRFG